MVIFHLVVLAYAKSFTCWGLPGNGMGDAARAERASFEVGYAGRIAPLRSARRIGERMAGQVPAP